MAGLGLRQTPPGAEYSHDKKGWEACGIGWAKRPPQGAGPGSMQVSKTYSLDNIGMEKRDCHAWFREESFV